MKRLCGLHPASLPNLQSNPFPPKSEILDSLLLVLNSGDRSRHLSPEIAVLYAGALQSCTQIPSSSHGLQIHSHVLKSGLDADRFVGNSLLAFYFKLCPDFSATRRLFDELPAKDVVSWTSMVSGYVHAGDPIRSLSVFEEMVDSGIEPNEFTLSAAIKACSDLGDARTGRCFHRLVILRGFRSNRVIGSSLVDMYGKNSVLGDARKAFDEMLDPDSICWTSMISAYTKNDRFHEALGLFHSMVRSESGLFPDGFTFGVVLTALGNLGRARQGKEAHAKIIATGLGGNVVVESSIVDMYAKCRLMSDSRRVFDHSPIKNAVTWCALLGGYCQVGDHETVLSLFRVFDKAGDRYSFGTVLRSCAGLAAVKQGKEIHCQFIRTSTNGSDIIVESALVDLYAKCGVVDYASCVFRKMSTRNSIAWNAMICGFAQNGRGGHAVELFEEMVRGNTRPDYISFVGLLFACSHTGLVEEGRMHFKSMRDDYMIEPGIEHCNCMVDLLSRVGLIEEAEDLIRRSEYRDDSSLWAALLGACSTYVDPAMGERVAKKMMELEPGYHLSYVLLANVYRSVGRWREALEIWELMKDRGIKKDAGKSWIEAGH